ncbi:MAG: hypothetical protein U5N85_05495 [Arcicella sp.]|nr:hypothetical protein [Arcicella sp.]
MGLFDIFKKKEDKQTTQVSADYSTIDSDEKAQKLFTKKELVKLYLTPLEFGGPDLRMNILFVPPFANSQKIDFDTKIGKMLQDGLKLGYSANPKYKGSSLIPSQIILNVKGDSTITETINIW